jgi:hypothetical protein
MEGFSPKRRQVREAERMGKGLFGTGIRNPGGGLSGVSLANFAVPIFPIRASSIKQ